MHPTVRILVGSVAFLSVSILSSVEQAPYVQAGDDAEAFTGDGHRPAGVSQAGLLCKSSCVQALPPECSEAKSEACIQSCFCSATIERPTSCSPRQPCPILKEGKQACNNGLCMFQCSDDKECKPIGGVCRAGSCRSRTPDEVASCKATCDSCITRVKACAEKYNSCAAKCPPVP